MSEITELKHTTSEPSELRRWNFPKALWAVRAFSYPDYLLYWIGMVISFTGSWAQNIAQAWLVLDLTKKQPYLAHQGLFLGLVAACSTVPFIALALPAGVIADRFQKRKITLVTQTLAMVQAAILGALAYYHIIQIWQVLILATFGGIVSAIDVPARHSMTAEMVGKNELVNAVALGSLAFNGARIVGPAIGGILLFKYGASMCFIVNAISFIAAIVALALIKPPKQIFRQSNVNMMNEVNEGFRYVMSNALLRDLMLMTLIVCIFGTQYATIVPIWVKKILHQGPDVLSLIMSLTGVGAALGAITVATSGHKFRQGSITLGGTFILSMSLIVFAFTPSVNVPIFIPMIARAASGAFHFFFIHKTVSLSVLVMAFAGYGMMLFLSVSNSLIQISAPDNLRGRVMSIRTLMFMGIAPPIGALLSGYLVDHAGAKITVIISGAICFLVAVAFSISSKVIRRAV